ncbi:MAG: biotin synthase BioB [Gammaproteobacteria bacterium]|nr:biotin synthase BioB [Gammaproteobacteria bacterium]
MLDLVEPAPVPPPVTATAPRWTLAAAYALLQQPLNDLLYQAHQVHRQNFNANEVQLSTLLNIKSGGCPEDCSYCPQSARYETGLESTALMNVVDVMAAATKAKNAGATRFCMGAAWRSPKDREVEQVAQLVSAVKGLGLETCVTLGMLKPKQANRLKTAGLDYYNHNLDTSPEHYGKVITTRTYNDRLETLEAVREAGVKVCCGGIVGLGESPQDRASLLCQLANLPEPPESVPINQLVRVEGTPLADEAPVDCFEVIRTIAAARIMMPKAFVRLSAGRRELGDAGQALAYFAGANSIFYGEQLLTTPNPPENEDRLLFAKLGIRAMAGTT